MFRIWLLHSELPDSCPLDKRSYYFDPPYFSISKLTVSAWERPISFYSFRERSIKAKNFNLINFFWKQLESQAEFANETINDIRNATMRIFDICKSKVELNAFKQLIAASILRNASKFLQSTVLQTAQFHRLAKSEHLKILNLICVQYQFISKHFSISMISQEEEYTKLQLLTQEAFRFKFLGVDAIDEDFIKSEHWRIEDRAAITFAQPTLYILSNSSDQLKDENPLEEIELETSRKSLELSDFKFPRDYFQKIMIYFKPEVSLSDQLQFDSEFQYFSMEAVLDYTNKDLYIVRMKEIKYFSKDSMFRKWDYSFRQISKRRRRSNYYPDYIFIKRVLRGDSKMVRLSKPVFLDNIKKLFEYIR